jgi:hypothetical protein
MRRISCVTAMALALAVSGSSGCATLIAIDCAVRECGPRRDPPKSPGPPQRGVPAPPVADETDGHADGVLNTRVRGGLR